MPLVVRYALAAAIVCAIGLSLFFFITMIRPVQGIVLLSAGTPGLIEQNETSPLSPGMSVNEESTIVTENDTLCGIQIMEYALFKMNEKSRLTIRKLHKNSFSLDLLEGELLIKTEGLKQGRLCEVTTPGEIIRFGSTLLIRYTDNLTYVALHKGTAQIMKKGVTSPEKIITLSPGEAIYIGESGVPTKKSTPATIVSQLSGFAAYEMIQTGKQNATLSVITNTDNAALIINKKEIERFHNNLSLTLQPGAYTIDIIKKGYRDYSREIELLPGESLSLDIQLVEKWVRKEWKWRVIHQYTNPDNPAESNILGFASSEDHIIAVTRTSLLCFKHDGTFVWERVFGKKERLIFDSLPYIYKSSVYISSNDTLLSFDILTGEVTLYEAPGIVTDGFGFSLFKNILYIPYADGIYSFNTGKKVLDSLPQIQINNPTPPLVTENGFYITSTISPVIIWADRSGRVKHQYKLTGISTCSPIHVKKSIIAGDRSGRMYAFSPSLDPEQFLQMESGITSLCAGDDTPIYIFTETGILSLVKPDRLTVMEKIYVDKIPETGIYFYKKPVLIENELYIGSRDGILHIIEGKSGLERKKINISCNAISCSLYKCGSTLFTGTKKGEIILLY
jgi:hypothetical protein